MIGINSGLGPLQALQQQVAARSDPSQKKLDDTRARDIASDKSQTGDGHDLTMPKDLADKLPKPYHLDFLAHMEAIATANASQEYTNDLSTDAARLKALQVRQQLETQPFGISNQASQLALALFR